MSKIELPPLPSPNWHDCSPMNAAHMPYFTADQLRARDRQIVEVCAQKCEWLASVLSGPYESDGEYAVYMNAAAAIRSLLGDNHG
jgi:hypothetical protein